jgi:hypothetical protein
MSAEGVVFIRIGWMESYQGDTTEQAKGGGKNNAPGLGGGGESENFLPDPDGRVHGYFAIGAGNQNIELFRVNGRSESRSLHYVSPVLAIFVAPHPDGSSVIVGWYRKLAYIEASIST